MKKNLFSAAAWILVLCIMLAALAGCSAKPETNEELTRLQDENAQLKAQIAQLEARLEELESDTGFKTWKLDGAAWSESNGANVTFTAEPRSYKQDVEVFFNVRLNGEEVENLTCAWNGAAYEAVAELEAADGYSYYCITVLPDGSREQIVLSSPDTPVYDTLVNMANSLTAYCNLFVADFEVDNGKLNITSGYVQVQLPQLTPEGTDVGYKSAQLVLELNGDAVESQAIELPQGEGAGSYETALTSTSFTMPEMEDDYQLDLVLNVTLSSGEVISAAGGSWFQSDGVLSIVVG